MGFAIEPGHRKENGAQRAGQNKPDADVTSPLPLPLPALKSGALHTASMGWWQAEDLSHQPVAAPSHGFKLIPQTWP